MSWGEVDVVSVSVIFRSRIVVDRVDRWGTESSCGFMPKLLTTCQLDSPIRARGKGVGRLKDLWAAACNGQLATVSLS